MYVSCKRGVVVFPYVKTRKIVTPGCEDFVFLFVRDLFVHDMRTFQNAAVCIAQGSFS